LSLVLFLVSCVAGQATMLPLCATECAGESATKVGCDLSASACLCTTLFSSTVLKCSETTSCSPGEQAQVKTILESMCGTVSVPASGSEPSTRSFIATINASDETSTALFPPPFTLSNIDESESAFPPPFTLSNFVTPPVSSSSPTIQPQVSVPPSSSPGAASSSAFISTPVESGSSASSSFMLSPTPEPQTNGGTAAPSTRPSSGAAVNSASVLGAIIGLGIWIL
ncbi:hypothetical protein GGX14DRAFT_443403, partial [Mycena pura]